MDTQRKIRCAHGKELSVVWSQPNELLIEISDPARPSHGVEPIGPVTLGPQEISELLTVLDARPGRG